jgi:RNA recognition motif-containing protein
MSDEKRNYSDDEDNRKRKGRDEQDEEGEKRQRREDNKNKIFVGGISFNSTNESLEDAFSSCGKIVSVYIPVHRDTGKKKGIAFVEFETEEATDKATKLNDTEIDGRTVRIEKTSNHQKTKDRFGGNEFNKKSIMIKNLSTEIEEEKVRGIFEKFGKITRCSIPGKKYKNKKKLIENQEKKKDLHSLILKLKTKQQMQ